MRTFIPIEGTVREISPMPMSAGDTSSCTMLMAVRSREQGDFNFVIEPSTYFVNHVNIRRGDVVTVFYDSMAPAPLIFPPQFRAVVVARPNRGQNVTVDRFDRQMLNSEGTLRLNIAPGTRILLENGQTFLGTLGGRVLTVVYGSTTRSIPAITVPTSVIVMCR